MGQFTEVGTLGLEAWADYVSAAYLSQLQWPAVFSTYDRIRRSDVEIGGIVRPAFVTMARRTEWRAESPVEDKEPVDEEATEFLKEVIEDIDGGVNRLFESWVSYAPFMGWYWQEVLMGVRDPEWKPPNGDQWRSQFSDNRIGVRRLAHRDHSTFDGWNIDDATGKVMGMYQQDYPNKRVMIPRDISLHLTFGDDDNPEGLSPLEAVYRLERMQRQYEIVHGIGSEHAAGYLKIQKSEGVLSDPDKAAIREMSRTVQSGKEGNYMALPGGLDGDIMDVPFSAADSIQEMITYLGILKLQVYQMQFVAIATTSGLGSQTAMEDAREQALANYNGMIAGFVWQFNDQVVKRLFRHPVNAAAFPGLKRYPKLVSVPIERSIPLSELSAFISEIAPVVNLGDDDKLEIRRASGILPVEIPEEAEAVDDTPVASGDEVTETGEGLTQEMVLNGAQMTAAIDVVRNYADGLYPRENAVFMIETFFNLPNSVAEGIVPEVADTETGAPGGEEMTDDEIKEVTNEMIQWSIKHKEGFAELWYGGDGERSD